MKTDRIILGIDPGTVVMGYGVIHAHGNKIKLVSAGVLTLDKKEDHLIRIKEIFDTVQTLISRYQPDEFAIEEPFFGKNVQSMLKLGRAQGAAISAALNNKIPVFGYSPRKIKQSVTGKGTASKEQVAAMLQNILKFEEMPKYLDATDALGVAVCHLFQNRPIEEKEVKKNAIVIPKKTSGKKQSWESFLNKNPDRIKK